MHGLFLDFDIATVTNARRSDELGTAGLSTARLWRSGRDDNSLRANVPLGTRGNLRGFLRAEPLDGVPEEFCDGDD